MVWGEVKIAQPVRFFLCLEGRGGEGRGEVNK